MVINQKIKFFFLQKEIIKELSKKIKNLVNRLSIEENNKLNILSKLAEFKIERKKK